MKSWTKVNMNNALQMFAIEYIYIQRCIWIYTHIHIYDFYFIWVLKNCIQVSRFINHKGRKIFAQYNSNKHSNSLAFTVFPPQKTTHTSKMGCFRSTRVYKVPSEDPTRYHKGDDKIRIISHFLSTNDTHVLIKKWIKN